MTTKAVGELRSRLLIIVTSCTADHGAVPDWLRTVKRMPVPFCAWTQLFSNRLPSISTRRAFFSSKRFFTAQGMPA